MPVPSKSPLCLIIAGPNGAGKTTFAKEFLPREAGIVHFVNADLIAAGLSPLKPAIANMKAGKVFLSEPDRLSGAKVDFAFESTLSGLTYYERMRKWKKQGYRIELVYLRLDSPEIALKRIAAGCGKADITCRPPMCAAASFGVGGTSRNCMVRCVMPGGSTTPTSGRLSFSKNIHESTCPRLPHQGHQRRHAPRLEGRGRPRPHGGHQALRDPQRQAGGREAVNLARTAQGRILTPKGYAAIGLKAAPGNQQTLL